MDEIKTTSKHNTDRKTHGFRCPWSIQQILIDGIFVYHVIIYFVIIFPIQSMLEKVVVQNKQIVFTTIYCILLILVLVYTILTTMQDPTETLIRNEYDEEFSNSKQTKSKMETLSLMRNCGICNRGVQMKTKHCNDCNRCCESFDHHCKFLNNCIGWNNYNYFFLLMVFVTLFLTLQFVATLYKIFQYVFHRDQYSKLVLGGIFQIPLEDYNILIIFSSIFLPIVLILAMYLLFFHVYLKCVNLSTYDYFLKKRREQNEKIMKQKEIQIPKILPQGKFSIHRTEADEILNPNVNVFQIHNLNDQVGANLNHTQIVLQTKQIRIM